MTNLFEILTRNRHGDYQEVNFTSVLSYFLDPGADHGLGDKALRKILGRLNPDYSRVSLGDVTVRSEVDLGNGAGKIDICAESARLIAGIEAKIWDKSARNTAKDGTPQLERYYRALSEKAHDTGREFFLVYLVPHERAAQCVGEFQRLKDKTGPDNKNLRLMAWWFASDDPPPDFLPDSMEEILRGINSEKNLAGANGTNVKWLLDSLIDFIPNFYEVPKEAGRFPSRSDLRDRSGLWELYAPFLAGSGRGVNPVMTTIGIPYGFGTERGRLHGNSLYRIRTTRNYYTDAADKDRNLPRDFIEIELWPDIYAQVKGKLDDWREHNHIGEPAPGKHLDEAGTADTIVLKIAAPLPDAAAEDFHGILREGYAALEHG